LIKNRCGLQFKVLIPLNTQARKTRGKPAIRQGKMASGIRRQDGTPQHIRLNEIHPGDGGRQAGRQIEKIGLPRNPRFHKSPIATIQTRTYPAKGRTP